MEIFSTLLTVIGNIDIFIVLFLEQEALFVLQPNGPKMQYFQERFIENKICPENKMK